MSKRLLCAKLGLYENLRSDVIFSDLKYVSMRMSNGDVSGQGGTLRRVLSKFIQMPQGVKLGTRPGGKDIWNGSSSKVSDRAAIEGASKSKFDLK